MNTPTPHRSDLLRQNTTNTHARSQTLERLSLTGLVIVLGALVVYYGLKQIRTIDESVADKSVALLKKDPDNTSAVTNSGILNAKEVSPTRPAHAAEKLQLSQQRLDQKSIAKAVELRIAKVGETSNLSKRFESIRDDSDNEIIRRASRRPGNLELQRLASGKSANYGFLASQNNSDANRAGHFSEHNPLIVSHPLVNAAIKRVEPDYPPLAKQAGVQGKVEVRILVDRQGNVVDTHVVAGHPLLSPAARNAAAQWKFKQNFGFSLKQKRRYIEASLFFTFRLNS